MELELESISFLTKLILILNISVLIESISRSKYEAKVPSFVYFEVNVYFIFFNSTRQSQKDSRGSSIFRELPSNSTNFLAKHLANWAYFHEYFNLNRFYTQKCVKNKKWNNLLILKLNFIGCSLLAHWHLRFSINQ